MLCYYPSVALMWILSAISSLTYLAFGATAILAPWQQFASLYMMSLSMQLSLYFWNRRYNVSPHEPQGSYGVAGMAMSSLTAPVYFSALVGIVLGKKAKFVVTAKSSGNNPDSISTFKIHLTWAAILAAALVYGYVDGRHHPAMLAWVLLQVAVCLIPAYLGLAHMLPAWVRSNLTFRNRLTVKELSNG
jgi:hypothetical protein